MTSFRPSSLPLKTMAHIHIKGATESTIVVNLTDTVSSILSIIGESNAHIIYDGQPLSPAFSLMFYGIGEGSEVTVISPDPKQIDSNTLYRNSSYSNIPHPPCNRGSSLLLSHRCNMSSSRLLSNESKRVKRFFVEKCMGKVRDPDAVYQRFQDAMNPITAMESARITDVYRSRIEANPNSFRRLCKKYRTLVDHEKNKTFITPTVLPEKAEEPSTDLLPELIQQPINHMS